jgi:hypothetical protein
MLNSEIKKNTFQKFFEKSKGNQTLVNTNMNNKYDNENESMDASTTSSNLNKMDEITYYLENGILPVDFENDASVLDMLQNNHIPTKIQINICIYDIQNLDTVFPFIEYIFIENKDNLQMEFPYIQIDSLDQQQPSTNETIKINIFNEVIPILLDILNIHDSFNETLFKEMYVGFLLKETEKSIYLFFQNTMNATISTPKYQHAIMDEILYIQKIQNIPIQKEILHLFNENYEILGKLKKQSSIDENNIIIVENPLLLYLCQTIDNKDDTFNIQNIQNVQNTGISDNTDALQSYHLLLQQPTLNHPLFGNDYYYFTTEPILLGKKIENIKKYAVFTKITENGENEFSEESYIVKDISQLTEEQVDNYKTQFENTENIVTVSFQEKEMQFWCIKTPNQFTEIN